MPAVAPPLVLYLWTRSWVLYRLEFSTHKGMT